MSSQYHVSFATINVFVHILVYKVEPPNKWKNFFFFLQNTRPSFFPSVEALSPSMSTTYNWKLKGKKEEISNKKIEKEQNNKTW